MVANTNNPMAQSMRVPQQNMVANTNNVMAQSMRVPQQTNQQLNQPT
jgi:hypothetical protein